MNRLKKYDEHTLLISTTKQSATEIFSVAVKKHATIKDILLEEGVILAKSRYLLQFASLEFVFESQDDKTLVRCRGKSDDLGNATAMRFIEKIINTANDNITGDVKIETINKPKKKNIRQKVLYVILGLFFVFVVKESMKSPDKIYGTYYLETENNENTSNHFEVFENGEIRLHVDSRLFGVSNRRGRYTTNDDKTELYVVFNDGLPELNEPLLLKAYGSNWHLINGETVYVKN